jgi:multidrug efflux pump subunit AcrA (membrane-fusion protein)
MRRALTSKVVGDWQGVRLLVLCLLAALVAPGCGHEAEPARKSVSEPPTVRVIRPPVRTIVRIIDQPGFIQSYERTSIYPKLTGYIEKWIVDIGDKVKKGDVLATLFVPELNENLGTKKAMVALEKERIEMAKKQVSVAEAEVKAAQAHVVDARASLLALQTETDRWDSEVKRLTGRVQAGVVSPQILLESTKRLQASTALRDAAKATVERALADQLARESDLAKAKVDVDVADARLTVAQSDEKRLEAWVGYLTLTAPFDGVIVRRNANTFDFVLPKTGDPTAMPLAPNLSPRRAAPIYVVDRTDVVRAFVDVPERDASYVHIGTKAAVLARAFRDKPLEGKVTRTAWALNVKSRTLRAEIDLPNIDQQILPGMYAYGRLIIERPKVRALPIEALDSIGDQTFCWQYENGKAKQVELETGLRGDAWIEITRRRDATSPSGPGDDRLWAPVDGSEDVILGDLSVLVDGGRVKVAETKDAEKAASAASGDVDYPAERRPAPLLRRTDGSAERTRDGRWAASGASVSNGHKITGNR